MALLDVFTQLTAKLTSLKSNKVVSFAYTQDAYVTDVVATNENKGNSIPEATEEATATNTRVLTKGERSQSASLARNLINHFFGRSSFNLNKVIDTVQVLVALIQDSLQNGTGIASLGSNGRVPESQIPEDVINYRGAWNASTNTPDLSTVAKEKGDMYLVSVAGTQGGVKYFAGDQVIYNGSVWEKIASGNVDTVNHKTPGVDRNVVLYGDDVEADLPYPLETKYIQGTCTEKFKIQCIFFRNNMYMASVEGYGIWWSDDGLTWTQTNQTTNSFRYIIWDDINDHWFAAGSYCGIWKAWNGKDDWVQVGGTNVGEYNYICSGGSYGDTFVASNSNTGLWYSDDGDGDTWTQATGVTSTYRFREIIYLSTGKWIACSEAHGLWASLDAVNWTQITGDTSSLNFNSIKQLNNGRLIASASNGMWYSSDSGVTWTRSETTPSTYFYYIEVDGNFAVVGGSTRGLWWTEDGVNWTQGLSRANTFYTVSVTTSELQKKWIAGGYNAGLWVSSDGKNWSQLPGETASMRFDQYCLCATPSITLAGATFYGMWYSTDFETVHQINLPFITQFNKFAYAFNKCIGLANRGYYYSEDGVTWKQSPDRTSNIFYMVASNGTLLVAGSGSVLPTWSEDGVRWTLGTADITNTPCNYIIYSASRQEWFAGTNGKGILRSSDGKNWEQCNTADSSISSYAVPYLCCVGTIVLTGTYQHGILKCSSTPAVIWTHCTSSDSSFQTATFRFIMYNEEDSLWLAGSDGRGIWWSTDGTSWTKGTGTSGGAYRTIAYHDGLYLAGANGLYSSTDGKNWAQLPTTSIPYFNVTSVTYADGMWMITSSTDGVWYSIDGKKWKQAETEGSSNFNTTLYVPQLNKWLAGSSNAGAFSARKQTKASISDIISYLKEKFGYTTT